MESLPFIEWCLEHLNYFTITLLMIVESSFIPFPSEVVIPPAAYIAATSGDLNVYLVVLFGTLGAVIGALINYGLAMYLGRPIIYRFANSRLGAICLIDAAKVEKAEKFFDRNGSISTFVGRLIPGIRQLISIPAGLARMSLGRFILFTAIGGGIWNAVLAGLGYYAASVVPRDQLMDYITRHSREVSYVIIGIVVIVIGILIYKATKKPKSNNIIIK
ncbi:DedA family protein [Porphyromonas sp.]|uniref:DedA family protein n=1 Tax=Porphyromonas sp. TaxID=1924944 RepID=UPI0026DDB6B1|nr:DedA family protein [Porphyromonas sp.]MDO4695758.1 DedA family protein [Porphyromonas sp.]MDO4770307.1 DedA family protein [Porphyromonas sp.]